MIKRVLLTFGVIFLLFYSSCEDDSAWNDIFPIKVEFEDVWFENMIDNDGDGYFSGGALYYDLKCNKSLGVKCYIWLGYKRSVFLDSTTYHGLCSTTDKNVDAEKDNIWYIPIGQCITNLPHDFYHLQMAVVLSSDKTCLDRESDDSDLHYIPLEPPSEDTIAMR